MKKIKLLLCTIAVSVCCCITTPVTSNASSGTLVKILDNIELDFTTTKVLSKGYYIFASGSDPLTNENFVGDIKASYFKGGNSYFTAADYNRCMGTNVNENDLETKLITPFREAYRNEFYQSSGVFFINVYSCGAFTKIGYLEHVIGYGLELESQNETSNIAGNKTHVVSVDHPISVENLKTRYTAEDNVDGSISDKIHFETNYNPDVEIGSYYAYVTVSDQAGHTTKAMDIVLVRDFAAPNVYLKETHIEVPYEDGFTLFDAKKYFYGTDNYCSPSELTLFYKTNLDGAKNGVGTYYMNGYMRDYCDNDSETIALTVDIIDNKVPTISLKSGGDFIQSTYKLSDEEIKGLLQVSDNYYTLSSDNIKVVKNTCDNREGVEFEIVVQIEDGSGNVGESTFRYLLTDTTYPVITVDKTIYIPAGQYYDNKQILSMLKEQGIISQDAVDVQILSSFDYNNQQDGTYTISYVETYKDGTKQEKNVNVTIFSPSNEIQQEDNQSNFSNWYYLLFLLPVGAAILFFIIKSKHEKN